MSLALLVQRQIAKAFAMNSRRFISECWFWLAQYGPTPVVPRNWKTWTMWQYTDGALGPKPHTVKGIGRCDRDKFNGTEAQLRKLWGAEAQA
jgi:lysozyme